MAKAILITTTDLKRHSILNGNVDNDKFIQYLNISQDIHLQRFLGTDLLEKLQSLLPTDIDLPINADYKALLETYVKPMLIHWGMVEFLPFAAYTISNGGVYKHQSENSVSVDKNEIDFLVEKERNIAQNYTRRFVDYICDNNYLFPEYLSNSGSDVYPSKKSNFGGWII
jgi:hypothetical protein